MKPAANRAGSTKTGLAFLDFPLSFAGEILKLPTGGLEGVADSHVDVVVGIRNVGISADCDIGGPGYRKMDTHLIGVALVVPVLRPADNHARRGNAIREGSSFFQSSPMRVSMASECSMFSNVT